MKKQGHLLSAMGLCSSLLLFSAHPAWANNYAQASTTAKASVAAPSTALPSSSKPKKKITSSRTRATLQPKLYSYQAPGTTHVTKLPGSQLPANAIVPKVVVLPGNQLPAGAIVPTAQSSRNTTATTTLPPLQITPAQEPPLTTVAPLPKKAHPNSVPGEDPAWGDYQYHR